VISENGGGTAGKWQAVVFLAATFVVLYLLGLGVRPLFIPDEVRYGEIAREMLASGNWIVPRLNGLLYFEKPPFGHWLNAASLFVFGDNPYAVRFATAVATAASALTVFLLGRRLLASTRIAVLATFIFLTTLEVQVIGTFGVLDAIFAAVLSAGIAAFAVAAESEGPRRTAWLTAAGGFLGLAFLSKGFLAFVLPVLVLAPWLLLQKRYRLLFVEAWIVGLAAVLVAAPWSAAIHLQQPDFWRYFIVVEHLQRFASDNAQHKEPFYYYLMYLPLAAFPWIFLLPAASRGLRRSPAGRSRVQLLVLWAAVPLVFFSISSGKLVTYILPCFVPFSLLLAAGLQRLDRHDRRVMIGLAAAAVVLALFTGLVAYLALFAPDVRTFDPDESGKLAVLLSALGVSTGLMLYAAFARSRPVQHGIAGAAAALILLTLPWVVPRAALESKAPVEFIRQVYAACPDDTVVVTNGSLVRAVSWALKRADVLVVDDEGETRYGLQAPDAQGRFLSGTAFSDLLESGQSVLLLCKGECSADTMSRLPTDAQVAHYGKFGAFRVAAQTDR